jgi:hypothetical protein
LEGGEVEERGCCCLVRYSPSSSKKKNVLNGGRENIKFLCSTNFQLLSVGKNTGGKNYLFIYIERVPGGM